MTVYFFYTSFCLLAVIDLFLILRFLHALYSSHEKPLEDHACPPAAVILCLRGADPALQACLDAILEQDYPDYYLHIVVDSDSDPALAIVKDKIRGKPDIKVIIETLNEIHPHASLKCSSQIQAVSHVDASIKVIAFVDADTIPEKNWLRRLISVLLGSEASAVSGVRWFAPDSASWGSLIRYIWNAGVQPHMLHNKILWGGSLALRREIFDETGLLQYWQNCFCEDTSLNAHLDKYNLKLIIQPALITLNNETTRLPAFIRYLERQLLTVRLHHPAWPLVAGYTLLLSIMLVSFCTLVIFSLLENNQAQLLLPAIFFLLYQATLIVMLISGETVIRKKPRDSKEEKWLTLGLLLKFMLAIPVIQIIQGLILIKCMFLHEVEWRKIKYAIHGKNSITLREYQPYTTISSKEGKSIQNLSQN